MNEWAYPEELVLEPSQRMANDSTEKTKSFEAAKRRIKQPISCLVVIYCEHRVLLLERKDHSGYWQSVTGSWEVGESLSHLAQRELNEETGLTPHMGQWRDHYWSNQYEIYPQWRYRYPTGVIYNTEHVFSLQLNACHTPTLSEYEHSEFMWIDWKQASQKVFSPSNRRAIEWIVGGGN
ncbi:MAG: dihydroneopterin triphosphate diphosphatase [Pseudomonadota bacterium]